MIGFKTAFALFCDCWNLYSKYAVSALEDEELQKCLNQAQELYYKKYQGVLFAKEMVLAVIGEIDRIEKSKKR